MKKALILSLLLGGSMLAQADWALYKKGDSNNSGYFYNDTDEAKELVTIDATAKPNDAYIVATDKAHGTVSNVNVSAKEGQNIHIDVDGWGNNYKFESFTIQNLTYAGSGNGTLSVGAGQNVTVNTAAGLTSVVVDGTLTLNPSNISTVHNLTFGENGKLAGKANFGQTKGALTLTLTAADTILSTIESGSSYTQALIGEFWNAENITSTTITVAGAEGLANGGLIFLKDGIYYSSATYSGGWTTGDVLSLQKNTIYAVASLPSSGPGAVTSVSALVLPEPATATLSLLALAGLAARRRRH